MEKAQLGAFIAENRKAEGMTQKDLAERLHVTDKAVSKWERGLSYPDVTLLEPLAEVFHMGVTELAACDRNAGAAQRTEGQRVEKEEQVVKTILSISGDSLRETRGRGRRWIVLLTAALAAVLAVLAVLWQSGTVLEAGKRTIRYKEAVGGERYIFLEQDGHLLRLKCGDGVDYDSIVLVNGYGLNEPLWDMAYRWNRRTWQGTVSRCEKLESIALLNPMSEIGASTDLGIFGDDALFGSKHVMVEIVDRYPNPNGKGYISSYKFWAGGDDPDWYTHADEFLLAVTDCLGYVDGPGEGFTAVDMDGDGENELLVRTPWPEKPCILYDRESGEITETWLDTIPPEMNAPSPYRPYDT